MLSPDSEIAILLPDHDYLPSSPVPLSAGRVSSAPPAGGMLLCVFVVGREGRTPGSEGEMPSDGVLVRPAVSELGMRLWDAAVFDLDFGDLDFGDSDFGGFDFGPRA